MSKRISLIAALVVLAILMVAWAAPPTSTAGQQYQQAVAMNTPITMSSAQATVDSVDSSGRSVMLAAMVKIGAGHEVHEVASQCVSSTGTTIPVIFAPPLVPVQSRHGTRMAAALAIPAELAASTMLAARLPPVT